MFEDRILTVTIEEASALAEALKTMLFHYEMAGDDTKMLLEMLQVYNDQPDRSNAEKLNSHLLCEALLSIVLQLARYRHELSAVQKKADEQQIVLIQKN